jgi:hypothetical protein
VNPTKNSLDAAKRGKSMVLLGMGLVHALDLERQAKQAHWNVKGANFGALHELFDRVARRRKTTRTCWPSGSSRWAARPTGASRPSRSAARCPAIPWKPDPAPSTSTR